MTSNRKEITRGCAQESSLGPLLWNVYQNDIFFVNRRSQLSANTDDHHLYFSCREPAIQEINTDGKKNSEWYNENFLKENLSKDQTMIISKQESDGLDIVKDRMTITATAYHH